MRIVKPTSMVSAHTCSHSSLPQIADPNTEPPLSRRILRLLGRAAVLTVVLELVLVLLLGHLPHRIQKLQITVVDRGSGAVETTLITRSTVRLAPRGSVRSRLRLVTHQFNFSACPDFRGRRKDS